MNECRQFKDKSDAFLLNTLSDEEKTAFLEHMETCPLCRDHFQQLLEDFELFRSMSKVSADTCPDDMAGKVIRTSRHRRRKKAFIAFSLALFVATLSFLLVKFDFGGEPVRRLWTVEDISAAVNKSYPLVSSDRVVALKGRYDSLRVVCFDVKTGRELWLSNMETLNSLAADDRYVYAWTAKGRDCFLIALNLSDGTEAWRSDSVKEINPFRLPEMTVGAGRVYWSYDNKIISYGTSSPHWKKSVGLGKLSAPVFYKGAVMIAGGNALYSFAASDGKELARWDVPSHNHSAAHPILLVQGKLAVVAHREYTGQADVVCIELPSGKIKWQHGARNLVQIASKADKFCLRSDAVTVLNTAGELLWQHDTGGCSHVALSTHSLYTINDKEHGEILAFDLLSGKPVKKIRLGAGSCNGIVIKNKTGFLRSHDSKLVTVENL